MRNHNDLMKENNEKQNIKAREYAVCRCLYKNCIIHETKNQTNIYDYQSYQAITKSFESYENEKYIDRHTNNTPTKTTPLDAMKIPLHIDSIKISIIVLGYNEIDTMIISLIFV